MSQRLPRPEFTLNLKKLEEMLKDKFKDAKRAISPA